MTAEELQSIISQVLSAIQTNSKSIEQLTRVTSLADTDLFEVSGGKSVSFEVLKEKIKILSTAEVEQLKAAVANAQLESVWVSATPAGATIFVASKGKIVSAPIPLCLDTDGDTHAGLMSPVYLDWLRKARTDNKTALDGLTNLRDSRGKPNGLATLDENGKVPDAQTGRGLPGGVAPLGENGMVPSMYLPMVLDDVVEFAKAVTGSLDVVTDSSANPAVAGRVIYCPDMKRFVWESDTTPATYFANWTGADTFGTLTQTGRLPLAGKIYIDTSSNRQYRWAGTTMAVVGSDLALGMTEGTAFPGNAGRQLVEYVNKHIEDSGKRISEIAAVASDNADDIADLTRRVDEFNPVGNCYNVTAEVPLPAGEYYTLETAIAATLAAGVASLGLQISFAIAEGSWKTYQYIGPNTTGQRFSDTANWIDMAGLSAGTEAVLNVNTMCGDRDYTLSLAIQAVCDLSERTGIEYRRDGLVITYRRNSDPAVWETKQFRGHAADFTAVNEDLWHDFGGGDSDVTCTDKLTENSPEAVSSGAVYDAMRRTVAGFEDKSDADNHIFQPVNFRDEEVGDPISIPRGGGGSGQPSGSVLNIYPESQAVWGQAGGVIVLRAAVRAVSFDSGQEIPGMVRRIAILDADTRAELWGEDVNRTSSASATDYGFSFPFTDFFTQSGARTFLLAATDGEGTTRTKAVTVTAVDVTVESAQSLWYSTQNSLEVGGAQKSIAMYRFPRNVSTRQGIEVTTEILWQGEWKLLGKANITDTYTHNISVNPCDVFGGGEKMSHGGYQLRIRGKDVASGIQGNTLYTGLMCVDESVKTPVVVMRYNDTRSGSIRLYDTLSVDVAAYTPGQGVNRTEASLVVDGDVVSTNYFADTTVLQVSRQVQGYATDGTDSIEFYVRSGTVETGHISLVVSGSVIDVAAKEGALFALDFGARSNSEPDHAIADNGVTMTVQGCNWSTNGFVPVLGEQALRIADGMRASLDFAPFGSSGIETTGCALQFAFATRAVNDPDKPLMSCSNAGGGIALYVYGNRVEVSLPGGEPAKVSADFRSGRKVTVAVVVEPASDAQTFQGAQYACVKLYVDGELAGVTGYRPSTNALRHAGTLSFDSEAGDIALYYITAWGSHMQWREAFGNYLTRLTDTEAMVREYNQNNILDESGQPSRSLLLAMGIPCYTIIADETTFTNFDYALNGGTSTSDQFACTVVYENPLHPEVSFRATDTLWKRQGTTSAQRPEKNDRMQYNKKNKSTGKKATVTLLNPDDSTQLGRNAIAAAKVGRVFVSENGFFVDTVDVKKDYSDSTLANDCGVCELMNLVFRSLGGKFMTPAQRAFDGRQHLSDGTVISDRQLDHSTKNHPVAYFRATNPNMSDAVFRARGNWKESKGEQVGLGFQDVSGYNLGCLNYGDFIEFFGKPTFGADGRYESQETLDQIEARFKTTTGLDTTKPYVLSQYCGRDYRIMRFAGGEWKVSAGSMRQVEDKWFVSGDVLNPVSGYELLQYQDMCWFKGVVNIDDMMAPVTKKSSWVDKLGLAAETYPAWTQYFECMIDNDQLQEDLALGRKVPYDLFNLLSFFGTVDSTDSSAQAGVSGWAGRWRQQAWCYMSMESAMAYAAFTDYLAAVDQRAKNMQPMFFLEDGCEVIDGEYSSRGSIMQPVRMYLNKVYDCDTCNGADNDGGRGIDPEVDPNKPTDNATGYTNPYMGWGSLLFNNIDKCPEVINSDAGDTISLQSVADRMRRLTVTYEGRSLAPFSPDGAKYFFVEKRIESAPKVLVSADCQGKYIDRTWYANKLYYYACHGSCRTTLPYFIETRWAARDGYYQTGDFFTNPLTIRMVALSADSTIGIKAAATGWFGIGNDGASVSERVFLEKGETHRFTTFAHDQAEIRIYQPGRIAELDLSQMSIAETNQFGLMTLCRKLTLGGTAHTSNPGTGFGSIQSLTLGDMPFLESLDVSNTTVTGIDATGSPRLKTVDATNTPLTQCSFAQSSPVTSVKLPASISRLDLVNLPDLTYPGGLVIASGATPGRLWIEGCPGIDAPALLRALVQNLSLLRLPDVDLTASVSILRRLKANGVTGIGPDGAPYAETGKCSGLTGKWICTEFIKAAELADLKAYFPALSLHNSQFSRVVWSDDAADPRNISNPENQTGYKYSSDTSVVAYEPTSHVVAIRDSSPNVRALLNIAIRKSRVKPLSPDSNLLFADGTAFDPTDAAGVGYDVMKYIPRYWYKGVNDFASREKLLFISVNEQEPMSTASRIVRTTIVDTVEQRDAALVTASQTVGAEPVVASSNGTHICRLNVEGMRLLRYPAMNTASYSAVFTDADGMILSVFSFASPQSDMLEGDYYIAPIPEGARWALFTVPRGYDSEQVRATDSADIESVEDWLLHDPELIGVYQASADAQRQIRSLSGKSVLRGTGTNTTHAGWEYDGDGNLTSLMSPMSGTINWTMKDCCNAAAVRGQGTMAQDYESWKDFAVMAMAITGTRDLQAYCGMGKSPTSWTTGQFDTTNPQGFSPYTPSDGNLLWGIQNYMGAGYEWVEGVAVNVASFASFKRNKYLAASGDPVDAVWHIRDYARGGERAVQAAGTSGTCIGKVRWGRYCDIICSQTSGDTSKFTQHYTDRYEYAASTARVVGRSGLSPRSDIGLLNSDAQSGCGASGPDSGARLDYGLLAAAVIPAGRGAGA